MSALEGYMRLPGVRRGFLRKATLWEGRDHVLLVRGTRFVEEYRRFYFKDIQSLQLARTFRLGSIGWLITVPLICGWAALIIPWLRAAWVALAAGYLLARLYFAKQNGCCCYIQTAVSREELPSLFRVRAARAVFERLGQRIEKIQGTLPSDVEPLAGEAPISWPEAPASPHIAEPADNSRKAARSVYLALTAFLLFLVNAAQTYQNLKGPVQVTGSMWLALAAILLIIAVGSASLASLLSALGIRKLKALRIWMVGSLFLIGAVLFLTLMLYPVVTLVAHSPARQQLWGWAIGIDMALCAAFGLAGIFYLLANWDNLRRGDL
jgi:hypothetical protein